MTRETIAGGCAVALMAGAAWGQAFHEDFDSYAVGDVCAQSAWEPWIPGDDVCGEVSDEVVFSGGRSLLIQGAVGGAGGGGDDTVHRFSGIEGGQWSFSTMTYVPSSASGTASFILLNTFPTAGNQSWSAVIEFRSDFGEIWVWQEQFTGASIITNEWVELRVDFDLDADTADYYYNDELIWETTWTSAILAGGEPRLQAVDLYGGEPTTGGHTGMYYDDMTLESAGCYADCDESGELDFFDFLCFQNEFAAGCS